jgi:NADPH:quinone reductase-like Zn-dependent oxidoreductase
VAASSVLMRAAGIETFGGEVQMLELAAPQSLAPDEVVIAVRAAGVHLGGARNRPGRTRRARAVPWEIVAAFPAPALTADQALGEVVPAPSGECSCMAPVA